MQNLRDFIDSDLAQLLLTKGLLSQTTLSRAERASHRANTDLQRTILELGLVPEDKLYEAMADWLKIKHCDASDLDIGFAKSLDLDRMYLERVEAVPLYETGEGRAVIATSNPRSNDTLRSLSFHLGVEYERALATRSTIKEAIEAIFDGQSPTDEGEQGGSVDIERLQALANDGPIIGQVNDLIADAVQKRASDIHIETLEAAARVRLRIDGELSLARQISLKDCATYVSRLKIMGGLNISEKRRPQDGRARVSVQGRNIDLRLATLPTQHGESIVIRILDRAQIKLDWDALGYPSKRVQEIEDIIHKPHGIFLVAGPTGSGKTTTLYTALSRINTESRKIITVEDPIEYAIDGVNQVQVEPEIDMTFARALRAILRQDPNVVLIGEIRDQETAEIAVRAALLGRLVLSTVHTNDALSTVDRLVDLGVAPYLLAATLRGVLSQRLIRKICKECAGKGCADCSDSGYHGRIVVSELMSVTAANNHEIAQIGAGTPIPANASIRQFETLKSSVDKLIEQGLTTEEEWARGFSGSSST